MTTTNFGRGEAAPQNLALTAYIRATPSDKWPVGHIRLCVQHPGIGWMPADGAAHRCQHWPDLYAVIGNRYCPRKITRPARIGRPHRAWLWLTGKPVPRETVINERWAAGCFRVPDMRGQW